MKWLKNKIIRVYSACCTLLAWSRVSSIGKGCIVLGTPCIRRKKNTRLSISDHVMLISHPRFNPLVRNRVSLNLMVPQASLELNEGCGLSGVMIVCCTHISVGRWTQIGANTVIYDCKQHQFNSKEGWRGCKKLTGAPIQIGDYCFIGMNCIVLKGVTIGDYCVISAGSVISKDVPSGYLAVGNPAKYMPLPERLRTRPDGSVAPLGECPPELLA